VSIPARLAPRFRWGAKMLTGRLTSDR